MQKVLIMYLIRVIPIVFHRSSKSFYRDLKGLILFFHRELARYFNFNLKCQTNEYI